MKNLIVAITATINVITAMTRCLLSFAFIKRYVIAAHTEAQTVADKSIIGNPCSERMIVNIVAIKTITIYDHIIDLSLT